MPKRTPKKLSKTSHDQESPDQLRSVDEDGNAPESRMKSAYQVYSICKDMESDDDGRARKRTRIFKQYNRFPPTEYSTLVQLKREDSSNVCWGQLAMLVDNTGASYYDMITERITACDIVTKIGDETDRPKWSQIISTGYDKYALRLWYDYLLNQEQDILDMGLYGKGIEFWDDTVGYQSTHTAADQLLVPDDTEISLSNFDVFGRKRKFTLHQLHGKIKNEATAKERGWDVDAVITAMRFQREDWSGNYTNETFMQAVANGSVSLTSALKERVFAYEFYCKEFGTNRISKFIVLQSYVPMVNLAQAQVTKAKGAAPSEEDIINNQGFLFKKIGYAKEIHEIMCVFMDSAGSGDWHNTPSLAEKVFVQCRQYDITMNNIMDAIRINMTLLLQGQTPDAATKLKELVWGGALIIPSDMPFVQQRAQIDTAKAQETLQFMMSDMFKGIGEYRVNESTPSGGEMTATQRQLDAAESAKLNGTQMRRFNEQHTIYHRQLYPRFVSLTRAMDGYENFEKFKKFMKEQGVPNEAWQWDNIDTITSNMIAGAGSPSYKLMASKEIIGILNMTPKDEGQRNAMEDGIAALAGRSNVPRYMPKAQKPLPDNVVRTIGLENEAFNDPMMNPENVPVFGDDPHIHHIEGHSEDMAKTIMKLEEMIQKQQIDKPTADAGIRKLGNQGGHVQAHLNFLGKDEGKADQVKQYSATLMSLQRAVQKLQQNLSQVLKEGQDSFDLENDPDIKKAIALAQIQTDTAQKISDIKISALASTHATREQLIKEGAATKIAITRATAAEKAKQPQPKPSGKANKTPAAQPA